MPQNQVTHRMQGRVEGDDREVTFSDHRGAPVEETYPDEIASDDKDPICSDRDSVYRGMPLLHTPGKDVAAARESTLR